MSYVTIARWDTDGRGVKYSEFATEQEANDRLLLIISDYPDAFVTESLGDWNDNWHVNGSSETLSIVPRPPPPAPPPSPLTADDVWRVLLAKGTIVDADLPAGTRKPVP